MTNEELEATVKVLVEIVQGQDKVITRLCRQVEELSLIVKGLKEN